MVDFNVEQSYRHNQGSSLRHTEYRIDPGDKIFASDFASKSGDVRWYLLMSKATISRSCLRRRSAHSVRIVLEVPVGPVGADFC